MITKLTKEQKENIPKWHDKCIAIGRDTSPINKPLVEKSWNSFYNKLGYKEPSYWYCQSPLQAQIIINLLEKDKIFKDIWANLGNDIVAKIRANIWGNIVAKIRDNIWANLGNDIVAKIRDNIWGNIVAKIRDNIWANIVASIRDNIEYKYTYTWGQHDINWIAYYKYYYDNNLLEEDGNTEIINTWYDLAKSCGWCYTFENTVFICEKPCELNLNKDGRLHKDGVMALKYSDGYGLYMLNGIQVSKEIACTPAEQLDPKLILDEQNVDVQREIIKKIGADIVLKKLNAKQHDKWIDPNTGCEYELLHLKVNDLDRKYMFYEHASIKGHFYAQPVPPETANCAEGRALQLGIINRSDLGNTNVDKLIECFPNKLS